MSIPFGHQRLMNRYTFEGTLKAITPLRISSGRASGETDAPFMRTFDGNVYIPGSSLRGAIRSELERMLASVGESVAGLKSCTLFEKGSCAEKFREFRRSLQNGGERLSEDENRTEDQLIADYAQEHLCDVCRLFGSTEYASHIFFEDCPPVKTKKNDIRCCIRDGVGIDRDTGAARDGAKFDYEVIESVDEGPFFEFKMVAENIGNEVGDRDKKLINLILGLLRQGLHVGGKRTSGLGMIQLVEEDGKICKVRGFETPKALWNMLVAKGKIDDSIDWKEEIRC